MVPLSIFQPNGVTDQQYSGPLSMKKPLFFWCSFVLGCSILNGSAVGQIVIWQETFDGTGNWFTASLNQNVGANGCNANPFFISCQENGNAPGSCGSACGTNQTLHVGSISFGDTGAAFDAGGGSACGSLFTCLFGGLCNTTTNRRSRSNAINTVGHTGISVEFDYIENGSGSADDAFAEYSINSGSSWNLLSNMPKTPVCGSGQGRWTHIVIPLPPACSGITTLMVAFRWVNNNDGLGSDPSFAVNNVQITKPGTLPVELTSFTGEVVRNMIALKWHTASELNNAQFIIERSSGSEGFVELDRVRGAGTTQQQKEYQWMDQDPQSGINYYRLRQIDFDGTEAFSSVVPIIYEPNGGPFANLRVENGHLLSGPFDELYNGPWEIRDMHGRMIKTNFVQSGLLELNVADLSPGVYVIKLFSNAGVHSRRFVR